MPEIKEGRICSNREGRSKACKFGDSTDDRHKCSRCESDMTKKQQVEKALEITSQVQEEVTIVEPVETQSDLPKLSIKDSPKLPIKKKRRRRF